jgi:hypothetical protein
MEDSLKNYITDFIQNINDFSNSFYYSDYNGPSESYNTDQKVLDTEILKLIDLGLLKTTISISPKRYIMYIIWLHNQPDLIYNPNVIAVLTKMIVNRLWRHYNRGTKLMFLEDLPIFETSDFIERLKINKSHLSDIIEKCNQGSIIYKKYTEDIESKKHLQIAMENSKNYRLNILFDML